MSISAESLRLHEPGEPDDLIFVQLRSEAEGLLNGQPPANTIDWHAVDAAEGLRFISAQPVVKKLTSQVVTVMPGDDGNVVIDLVRRIPSPCDYVERQHTYTLGQDIPSSSHLLSMQEFEFTFGKRHAMGAADYAVGTVEREDLISVRGLLEDIILPKAPKERLLRRAARWLLHH